MNRIAASELWVTPHAFERLLDAVGEQHAVRQAGERIVQRTVLHRVLDVLALDRVGEDVGDRQHEVGVRLQRRRWARSEKTRKIPHGLTGPSIRTPMLLRTPCSIPGRSR